MSLRKNISLVVNIMIMIPILPIVTVVKEIVIIFVNVLAKEFQEDVKYSVGDFWDLGKYVRNVNALKIIIKQIIIDTLKSEQIKKKDKENKIKEERDKKTKESKNNLDKQKEQRDILNNNKNKLDQEKTKNIKDRNEIQKKILDTKNLITLIIIRLKNISNKINDIAMNNNHLKTEEEYIDSLEKNMEEIGIEDDEQKKVLKEQKDLIKVFRETNKLDDEELMKFDVSQLADKLKIIIPGYIKQRLNK